MVIAIYFLLSIIAPIIWGGNNVNSNSNNNNGGGGGGSGGMSNNGGSDKNEMKSDHIQLTSRVVHTKYGAVSGVIIHLEGRHLDPVESFKGIPYASPPIGSLRFMPPVTGALWSGVKKADRFGPVCPQRLPDISNETQALERMPKGRLEYLKRLLPYLKNQSEDCLYLNIYAPVGAGARGESGSQSKYPVMVFVHGESYEWNSGNPYDGSILASYGQILVVTINYRLGILGFLNANTDKYSKSPANYGLMDIIAALHWLQENIGAFGGDSRSVTLAGHGTGAACVHYLIASSAVPEGLLFHRAMLLSGTGLAPWSLVADPAHQAAVVSNHVNCSPDLPHQHLMKCLRETSLELLISTPIRPPEFGNAFGPSIDGVVIDTGEQAQPDIVHYDYGVPNQTPNKPKNLIPNTINTINSVLLRKNAVNKLTRYDLLLGVTRAESYFIFNSEDVQYGIEADRRTKILKTYVRSSYSYHLSEILATIVNEYTDWERPVQHPINIRDETLEALSDAQVVAPAAQTADLHSADHRNSFLYVFDYQTKYGDYPQRQGCIHGEDLPYIFGAPLAGGFNHFTKNYTKSETILSEAVMLYWSNFVKTGNPNEPLDADHNNNRQERRLKNIEWTPYESVHKKYLNLDTKPKLKNHYRAHRLSFWLNLVPDLHKPGGDDIPLSHHELADDSSSEKLSEPTIKPLNPPPQKPNPNQSSHNFSIFTAQPFPLNLSSVGTRSNKTHDYSSNSSSSTNKIHQSSNSDVDGLSDDLHSSSSNTQEDGFAAYSTALSVTIAIGCSLLILNVLIFAGVYYQRDKTRLHDQTRLGKKHNENGQMPNNICGDLENLTLHSKSDPTTILSHHHAMQHHQLPPPEFADIPQRAPPPPKHLKSSIVDGMGAPHGMQLVGSNCGTMTKKGIVKNSNTSSNNQANVMDELRV